MNEIVLLGVAIMTGLFAGMILTLIVFKFKLVEVEIRAPGRKKINEVYVEVHAETENANREIAALQERTNKLVDTLEKINSIMEVQNEPIERIIRNRRPEENL